MTPSTDRSKHMNQTRSRIMRGHNAGAAPRKGLLGGIGKELATGLALYGRWFT